jgi:hypothetical protein
MLALRGGQAMASHGRHILLDNVAQIAARRRAKRGKGLERPSGFRNQPPSAPARRFPLAIARETAPPRASCAVLRPAQPER